MEPKILVVRLSSLGDVILTVPVYKSLKAQWPNARIAVLVKPQFAGVLEGNPYVDEVIRFTGLRQALRLARSRGFTHLLDLHGNLRSRLLSRLSNIPHRAVYRKCALARRVFVTFGWTSPVLEKHVVERYLDALAAFGLRPRPEPALATASDVSLDETGAVPRPKASPDGAGDGSLPLAARVLLIQSAFLGDSLLTIPLARDIKEVMPRCRLTVLTLPATAEIFERSPWVDAVIRDDKRGAHAGLRGPWRLAARLAEERFDLAIIPHRSLRSALLAYLSRIPRRIGFDSSAGRLFLTETVPFTWLMHDLERNLALLKPLEPGLRIRLDEGLYLAPDPAAQERVGGRLAQDGVSAARPLVGVHPGSAWPTKRWPPERFAELCRRLEASGRRAVLIGGPKDAPLCAEIARSSQALDWSGKTDLSDLKALMPRLSLFVTNDSGPMHLATACGVPTLAIFGPTTRELGFFPYGPAHRVLEADLACRPCGLHGSRACPHGHFLCMKLITTEQVWQSALQMMEAARPAPR